MTSTTSTSALNGVKHIIVVLSGKGGVGKSTVACQLAMALSSGAEGLFPSDNNGTNNNVNKDHDNNNNNASSSSTPNNARRPLRVGILDVDICGPSVPKICGAEDLPVTSTPEGKWNPVTVSHHQTQQQQQQPLAASAGKDEQDEEKENAKKEENDAPTSSSDPSSPSPSPSPLPPLKIMSIAYLLPSTTDAVVWRGPRKDAMIKQFLSDVAWGELDYLIVDTPPGTSDEHMTLCEAIIGLNPTGAVVVTTPQDVSTDDVRKELSFCAKIGLRVLGIVENMSGFICPHCSECTAIFSKGGGAKLATMYECPFLGEVPIDPSISLAEDDGKAFVKSMIEQDAIQKAQQEKEKEKGNKIEEKAVGFAAVVRNIIKQVERVEALKNQQQE